MSRGIENTLLWKILEKIEKHILIITSWAMVIIVAVGVVMRYIIKANFYGQDEILTIVATWMFWMGGVYGSLEDSHIKGNLIDTFVKNRKVTKVISLIAQAVSIVSLFCYTIWGGQYAIWNAQKGAVSSGLSIPLITSQAALFICMALMLFYTVYHFVRTIRPAKSTAAPAGKEG